MHIYVDADACPVVDIVEKTARKYQIPVTLLCDTNHVLTSGYSEVVVVGAGADAVDYKLISLCRRGDIVVTQDYGVAAMARRVSHKNHLKGPKKRTEEDDERFAQSFEQLIKVALKETVKTYIP